MSEHAIEIQTMSMQEVSGSDLKNENKVVLVADTWYLVFEERYEVQRVSSLELSTFFWNILPKQAS
jgi:hypothetical protein